MRALIVLATVISINNGYQAKAAESYLETVCMTTDAKPVVVVIRSDSSGPRVRGGDGTWMKGTSRLQMIEGEAHVHVKAVNVGGTLVVSFSSKGTGGLVTFALNNGNTAQYEARCVSVVIE